jgi:glycine betaine transporter
LIGKSSFFSQVRPLVYWGPAGILFAAVVYSLIDLDGLLSTTSSINDWILENFAGAFSWSTFLFVLTCVWAYFSKLGRVKIGGADAEPLLSKMHWFSITLCTTIAIGILFWATAEPIFHLTNPPAGLGLVAGSDEAAAYALSTLYMHWAFTPYAIYTVPGLVFALAYYNRGASFSITGPFAALAGRPLSAAVAQPIDALALFALMAGVAASLGAGMMSISGGLSRVLGIANTPLLQAAVTSAIVGAFVISSVTGLQRGIKFFSALNIRLFFVIWLFILVTGPTLYMLETGWAGLKLYVVDFLPRSLAMDGADAVWTGSWTVFYWANWLAWAPITALFLGRIARGYTVRQFITVNFFLPSLFAMVWMTVFGGASLSLDLDGGALSEALSAGGPESIAYELLARYPFASISMILFIFISFISYVTAADSNTSAIAGVCQKAQHLPEDGDASEVNEAAKRTTNIIKISIAVLIGAAAYVMTAFSGIDGVKMMSNLGGLPALFIVVSMNIILIIFGTKQLKKL